MATEQAPSHVIEPDYLEGLPEEVLESIDEEFFKKEQFVYVLPGQNFSVPRLMKTDSSNPERLHIRNTEEGLKCTSKECMEKKGKKHSLVAKEANICIHTIIVRIIIDPPPLDTYAKEEKASDFKFDRKATVDSVFNKVEKHFPSLTSQKKQQFQVHEKEFTKQICDSKDSSEKLKEYCFQTKCENCTVDLEAWPNRTKNSFLLSVGELKPISIPLKVCPKCKVIVYPDVIQHGLVPIHSKVLITYSMLMEIADNLPIGGSLIDILSAKITNLGCSEGLSNDFTETNVHNIALMIEQAAMSIISLLIGEKDLNAVICYFCGNCPKHVSSDGNTKDSIPIKQNMVFDHDDDSEIPDLESFKLKCAKQLFRTAVFQNEPKDPINMLKVPSIIAPKLVGKQTNSDVNKHTVFCDTKYQSAEYDLEVLTTVAEMIQTNRFDVTKILELPAVEIKKISAELNFIPNEKSKVKSQQALVNELKTVVNHTLAMRCAGEGVCHQYKQVQGHTGGWQDLWCIHCTKIGAKMETMQESVSDSLDLIQSLVKVPILHICDDACTLVAQAFTRSEEDAGRAYGK